MARVDAHVGTVTAPRPGGAWVYVQGRYVLARNALNIRPPPGSRVLVAQDATRKVWMIVGRER